MAFSRGLIISLGVSALSATLLFLYFRNKIGSIEKKVDVMFDLIQNYDFERNDVPQHNFVDHVPVKQEVFTGNMNMAQPELIEVSDDESDHSDNGEGNESDDSAEVSDSEYSDDEQEDLDNNIDSSPISLENTETIVLGNDDINKINVSIDEKKEMPTSENINDVDSLDEFDVSDPDDENNDEEQVDNENEESKVEGMENSENLIEQGDTDNESNHDDENESENSIDYSKLRVSELKAIAKEKGLTNYKSLKKQPLIDLLKSSE